MATPDPERVKTEASPAQEGPVASQEVPNVKEEHDEPGAPKQDQSIKAETGETVPDEQSENIKEEHDTVNSIQSQKFLWERCGDREEEKRLASKENAAIQAQQHMDRICDIVHHSLSEEALSENALLRRWISDIESHKKEFNSFEVLVGVAGATGAGKTSMLNALLGEDDILPAGQQEASTAVPCKMAWNFDEDPERRFRARVFVMSKEEIIKDLVITLKALHAYKELRDSDVPETTEEKKEKAEELEAVSAEVKKGMEKILAVYNLEEEAVEAILEKVDDEDEDMGSDEQDEFQRKMKRKAQQIFASNADVGELVDVGVQDLYAAENQELAQQIRPFLDSTKAQHGVGGGSEFAAWPLIKEVNIFLKSDILKTGICLVDLPGLGELGESRALVAQRFQEKLEVTLIVAPIQRAAHENIAQSLLVEHEAAQMRTDDACNRRNFGVVLSKTDGMKVQSYIRGVPGARGDTCVQRFQATLTHGKQKSKEIRNNVTRLGKMRGVAKSQHHRLSKRLLKFKSQESAGLAGHSKKRPHDGGRQDEISRARARARQLQKQVKAKLSLMAQEKRDNKHKETVASHGLAHWAVTTRNAHVRDLIHDNLRRRRREMEPSHANQALNDYGPEILPISATTFLHLEAESTPDEAETGCHGFPHVIYTGIPSLRAWIHRATLRRREAHLDLVLSLYKTSLLGMQNWSGELDTNERLKVDITSQDVEKQLEGTHLQNLEGLILHVNTLFQDVKKVDPFDYPSSTRDKFCNRVPSIVEQWERKFPDDDTGTRRMAHNTHRAIVIRGGVAYTAPSSKVTYQWNSTISKPLIGALKRRWRNKMHPVLPEIRERFIQSTQKLWRQYIQDIQSKLGTFGEGLDSHLNEISEAFKNGYTVVRLKVKRALQEVYETNRKIDNIVHESLESSLREIFRESEAIVGPKSFQRRIDFLNTTITRKAQSIFNKIWLKTVEEIQNSMTLMAQKMNEVVMEAVKDIKLQISLLLNRVLRSDDVSSQKSVREVVISWEETWNREDTDSDHILLQDMEIPTELLQEHVKRTESAEEEQLSDDSGSFESDSDEEMEDVVMNDMSVDALEREIERLKTLGRG